MPTRWRCNCSIRTAEGWLLAQAEIALSPEGDSHAAYLVAEIADHYVVAAQHRKVGAE